MEKLRKAIVPFSSIVFLLVVAGVLYSNFKSEAVANPTHPKRGDIVEQMRLLGKVQSEDKLDLGFQVSGKVSAVYVKVGSKVRKGQVLAELSPDDSSIAGAQAVSDMQVAQAQLQQAKRERDMQKARLKSIQESSSYNSHDEKAQKEVIKQSEANVEAKTATLQKMTESVQNSKLQISKTKMYSPVDGVVTRQSLERGEVVAAYMPAISLIGSGQLAIEAYVSEIEMSKISAGDPAKIRIVLDQIEEIKATVTSVDPIETVSGNVSSYKITFIAEDQSDKLKSGMVVDIMLDLGEKKNTLIVPMSSVFQEDKKVFVIVEDGKNFKKVEISLGVTDQQGNAEAVSGISEQDNIVSFNRSK